MRRAFPGGAAQLAPGPAGRAGPVRGDRPAPVRPGPGGVDTADEWAVAVEDKDLSAAYASQVPDIRGALVLPAE